MIEPIGANVATATVEERMYLWARQVTRDIRALQIAARQHGVISAIELRALGYSKAAVSRRVAAGWLAPLHPGVYAVASLPRSWAQLALAASRWVGHTGALSHRTAARHWEMEGIKSARIEVTTTRALRSTTVLVYRVPELASEDLRAKGGATLTSAERTLVDLGSVIHAVALERALDDCLRRGLVSVEPLRRRIEGKTRGRKGAAALRRVLHGRDDDLARVESELERRLLRLLKRHGVPRPEVQHDVVSGTEHVARLDFAYPDSLLAIESDGYRYHHGAGVWARDLARRSRLAGLGWRVIHVTWKDVSQRPAETVALIRGALERQA